MKVYVFYACVLSVCLLLTYGCGPDPDRFELPIQATLTGTILESVTDPSNPRGVTSARIQLDDANNAPSKGFLGPFFTDKLGNYVIPSIPPGIYDLVADKFVGSPAVPRRGRVRFIRLASGETRVIRDLVIGEPGELRGVVTLGGAGAAGNGGIDVNLEGTTRKGTTAANGSFSLTDLEAGVYTVVFQKSGFIEESQPNVEVLAGAVVNLTATMDPLNPQSVAAIRGQAVIEPRDPATGDHSGVTVTIEGTSRSLVTTRGGFFQFDSLPLATYTVRLEKRDTFTRRIPAVRLVPGEAVKDLGQLQLDTHRPIASGVRAFDLEHSPNGTQVAYIASSGEIAVMDKSGQIFKQVLTSGAQAAFDSQTGRGRGLSWSPDGKELLFVRRDTSSATLPFRIGVVPTAGGAHRTLLTSGNEFYAPAWSPDGKSFSYYLTPDLHRVDVSRDALSQSTAVVSTDRIISGNRPPGVVSAVSGLEAAVTGRIVYSFATSDTSNGIFSALVIASGGVNPVDVLPRLPSGQTLTAAESPTFSPDASRIAFAIQSQDTAVKGIYVMNLDGSNATRLTTQPGNNLDYSPDGSRVIFTWPGAGSARLGEVLEVLVPR